MNNNYSFNNHTDFPNLHLKFYITGIEDAPSDTPANSEKEVREDISIQELSNETNNLVGSHEKSLPTKDAHLVYQTRLQPKDYISLCKGETGIFVCGPKGFNSGFKNAIATLSIQKSSQIGRAHV